MNCRVSIADFRLSSSHAEPRATFGHSTPAGGWEPACRQSAIGNRQSAIPRPRGFSFTEILFAVMILGIGFIMVAAIFPVAIQQTESSNSEAIAASLGKAGASYMTQVAAMNFPPVGTPQTSMLIPTFLPTAPGAAALPPNLSPLPAANNYTIPAYQSSVVVPGEVWSLYDSRDAWFATSSPVPNHATALWTSVANNLIQPADPRFAWVAMYKRDAIAQGASGASATPATSIAAASYAQVILIGVQARNKPAYDANDIQNPPTTTPFIPQLLSATLSRSAAGVSTIRFTGGNTSAAAEGAYVVISDDSLPASPGPVNPYHGAMNGRIFRIGTPSSDGKSTDWDLMPGSDLSFYDFNTTVTTNMGSPTFYVFVVGRAYDPATKTYTGPAQDVSVYTSFVPIPN